MKRAVIVGATSGMGQEVAKLLVKEGWMVGIAGRRSEELAKFQVLKPEQIVTETIDINAPDATEKLDCLIEKLGGMDLYFHSSGYGSQNLSLEEGIELKTAMTNGVGFTRMIGAAYRHFRDKSNGIGHIAVISSIAGTKGLGAAPSYSATKRYQNTYIQALVQQTKINGLQIKFTDIRPGFVATDFLGDDTYPLLMKKEDVAQEILKAIQKKKRKVVIDWRYKILTHIWSFIPNFIWERMKIK
ncbi:MAG: SDR family NAD(P)-dependent oxidoreductase [Paludibacteraceae bacterium]|nr:SDR family NAD(P)-dependent oxidoreductase [Paludibacteraceae bacterium]